MDDGGKKSLCLQWRWQEGRQPQFKDFPLHITEELETAETVANLPPASPPAQTTELTEQQVLDIARKAVQENDTWGDRAQLEAKKNADGTWSATVRRIEGYDNDGKPQFVPGGHRFITVDRQGTVKDYMRGR